MAKIKKIKEKNETIYPITTMSAIYHNDTHQPLTTELFDWIIGLNQHNLTSNQTDFIYAHITNDFNPIDNMPYAIFLVLQNKDFTKLDSEFFLSGSGFLKILLNDLGGSYVPGRGIITNSMSFKPLEFIIENNTLYYSAQEQDISLADNFIDWMNDYTWEKHSF